MDPKFKAFSTGIATITSGIGLFFLWLINLAGTIHTMNGSQTFPEDTFNLIIAIVASFGLCLAYTAWGV